MGKLALGELALGELALGELDWAKQHGIPLAIELRLINPFYNYETTISFKIQSCLSAIMAVVQKTVTFPLVSVIFL